MVSRIVFHGKRLINSKQETILSAAAVIGFIYAISAFLGFIRNRILSGYFGDSSELGIFFAADAIPNLILSLIVSGSLSSAFIPVFTKKYKKDPKEAWNLTSSVLNISLVIFLIITIGVMFGADFISREIIARNSDLTDENFKLLANLMRVMMISQIIFIFSSFFTSVLQSFNRFIVPALAPVMYNLGMIIFLLLFVKELGIYAPAYGMIFGVLLHMGIQIPMARSLGFRYFPNLDFKNKGVREIYRLMIPRTIGQAAQKFLGPLYTNLALFISASSNVILTFATDLQNLPVRLFGISIGQAALPLLTNAYEDGDISKFRILLIKTLRQIVFFVLPVSILLFVLRVPMVRLAFGAKKYSWEATVMTAYSVGFFSISLVAQALILILSKAFYALCDTKTPLKISLISIVINVIFALLFVRQMHLGVWSLALAYSIGSAVNFILLFIYLFKKIGGLDLYIFVKAVNRISLATLITGIALYVPLKIMDELVFDTTRTLDLLLLTGTVSLIGFLTYIFFAHLMKIEELELVTSSIERIKFRLRRNSVR